MWHCLPNTDDYWLCLATHTARDEDAEIVFDGEYPPSAEQGAIFAEALNVHEQTGWTPAQLQARVAELEGALRDLYCAALDDVLKNDSKIDRPSLNRAGNVLDGVASA